MPSGDAQTPAVEELEGTIRISGAFAMYPMMLIWSEEYRTLHPKVKFDISAGGAGKGMADTLGGLVDIGMVSRAITPAEEEKGAYWIAVTKDAVVPTVNSNNPALAQLKKSGLTRDEFEQIYITGTIRTWGQATGETSNNDKINVYTRSDAAGAPETWAKYLGNYTQEELKGVGVNGDPGLAEAVRQDKLGIGYNNVNFAYNLNSRKPVEGIEIIPLDLNENGKIDPEENFYGTLDEIVEAIGNDKFPSPPARDLNLVTKGKPTGIEEDFIKWILTDGQKFIPESGYIVLPQDKINEGIEKVDSSA
ncbi:phosphate ABC transporter substrate-binding protein [Methanolobus chelungpuianus]|uniref:Phosphate ABC transporter substrate-binding protein n=1 Tax=Methanolobus chelungpuianus TaxID=502115 RepID=A0AAE3HCC8_9EURY|nr:phosphate ABC transporter substrate-binding protein [Methanolobus chelungpuianus]